MMLHSYSHYDLKEMLFLWFLYLVGMVQNTKNDYQFVSSNKFNEF